jgi:hypothetical protein
MWVGDGTALRMFPPVRARWCTRGNQATVPIGECNSRRTIVGMPDAKTEELVRTARCARGYPDGWPGSPPRGMCGGGEPSGSRGGIAQVFLPCRGPGLRPLEELRHRRRFG